MSIAHVLPPGPSEAGTFDEILDLTDRRRVFLRTIFGVSVPPDAADSVFEASDDDEEPGIVNLR